MYIYNIYSIPPSLHVTVCRQLTKTLRGVYRTVHYSVHFTILHVNNLFRSRTFYTHTRVYSTVVHCTVHILVQASINYFLQCYEIFEPNTLAGIRLINILQRFTEGFPFSRDICEIRMLVLPFPFNNRSE